MSEPGTTPGRDLRLREATAADASALAELPWRTGPPTPRDDAPVFLAEDDADVLAAASIDFRGGPTEPRLPWIELHRRPDAPADAETALLRHLIRLARDRGADRVVLGVDPMDGPALKRLEDLGFRPTGRGPYFLLGGVHPQYVTGYQDATGSILDLARDLARDLTR